MVDVHKYPKAKVDRRNTSYWQSFSRGIYALTTYATILVVYLVIKHA